MKTINDYAHRFKRVASGCWEWQGYLGKGGYGRQLVGSRKNNTRKQVLAHRLFYELRFGNINNSLCVLHKCDNRKCVNPDHLFLGTRLDNARDMEQKGRRVNHIGESNGRSKLTEEQVKRIKMMLKNGTYQKNIAEIYDINQTLVSAIKTGKIWTHV